MRVGGAVGTKAVGRLPCAGVAQRRAVHGRAESGLAAGGGTGGCGEITNPWGHFRLVVC